MILLCFLCKSVLAQEVKSSVINLEEVVISTTRFEETKSSSSGQISLITAKEIKNLNVSTIPDVLQQSSEVFVQKSQLGGGSPVVRGFEANKVLLVVDGIRMNNLIFRSGHLQNSLSIDPFVIAKAEVIHGAGSVMYGSDALGGVISFYSFSPEFKDSLAFSGEGLLRYSSASNEKSLHARLISENKNMSSLTAFSISDFGDLTQGRNRSAKIGNLGKRDWYVVHQDGNDIVKSNSDPEKQIGSAFHQLFFTHKHNFKSKNQNIHKINIQASLSSDIPRYDRLTEIKDTLPTFAEWYYGPSARLLAAYRFETSHVLLNIADESDITVAYQFFEESRNDRRFNNVMRNERTEKVNVLSLNADFHKIFSARWNVYYGTELLYNKVVSQAEKINISSGEKSALSSRYPDGGSSSVTASIYGYGVYVLGKRETLKLGIRTGFQDLRSKIVDKTFFPFPFNRIEQFNSFLSGSLSYLNKINDEFKLDVSLNSGFRNPNLDDIAKVFDSSPGNIIVPNPNINPEKTYTIDLGITLGQEKNNFIRAHVFYNWFKDIITTNPFLFNGEDSIVYDGVLSAVFAQSNNDNAFVYGATISAGLTYNKWIFRATGTYTYGRIETDSSFYPLDHIPPVFGRLSVNYQLNEETTFELYILANADKKLKDYSLIGEDNYKYATLNGMPSWTTLNCSFRHSIGDQWNFRFDLQNILDKNYRVFGSGISAAGRNYILSASFTF